MKRILKWLVPAIAVLVCGLLLLSWKRAPRIKADQVNEAQYGGKATGEGGTPEVQVYVSFQDDSYLIVSEFNCMGRDFEVSLRGADGKKSAWYYVNSEELEALVYEMVQKYADQ